jgi:hypothetical protein
MEQEVKILKNVTEKRILNDLFGDTTPLHFKTLRHNIRKLEIAGFQPTSKLGYSQILLASITTVIITG